MTDRWRVGGRAVCEGCHRLAAVRDAMVVHSLRATCAWGQSASTAEWAVLKGWTAMARDPVVRLSRRHVLQGGLALAGLGLVAGCGGVPFLAPAPRVPRIGFLGLRSAADAS